ncbi:MAG: YeeE/YedE family protein [Gammaproteobacteria bacterium]|jgi:uncharacterized membrane protein YedE/YeeE
MQINIIAGLSGGVLIGLASILLFASSGRIAGISGIMGGLYGKWNDTERLWRLLFLVGITCGAGIVSLAKHGLEIRLQTDGMMLVVAGLLVGFGTRIGGGCTSGHGVCGLARRSKGQFLQLQRLFL